MKEHLLAYVLKISKHFEGEDYSDDEIHEKMRFFITKQ